MGLDLEKFLELSPLQA